MSNRPTPSLTALRAFEAAARHLSIVRAAEELSVTPSAISHQISGLEATLGVTLTRRDGRRLLLTEEGQLLLPGLRESFARIAASLAELDARRHRGPLTISMLSTFAVRWFIPRLSRFQRRHPEIEVRVATGMRRADFSADGIDAAIRHGRGGWQGLCCDRLLGEEIMPVCSPTLATGETPLRAPEDLSRHTLLVSEARPDEWGLWLNAAGMPELVPARTASFETTNFAIEAAAAGAGVAVAARELIAEELATGRLIAPFAHTVTRDTAYFLVCPESWADRPKIAALRAWLLEEVSAPRR